MKAKWTISHFFLDNVQAPRILFLCPGEFTFGPRTKTHADSTHSHLLTMPQAARQYDGTTIRYDGTAVRVAVMRIAGSSLLSGTGHSETGGITLRERNTRANTGDFGAASFGASGVWQTPVLRFGCEEVAGRVKEHTPMASIQSDAAAMKPHTGPAAGEYDPGG